ncbi:MAG: DUF3253 domain-containing protein, partial [Pseudomonadota bacterium]
AADPLVSDQALEEAIVSLVAERGPDKTICPSEAARLVGGEAWREAIARTRDAAWRLAAAGAIEVCQKGHRVAHPTAVGPIRLRLVRQ